MTSMFKDLLKKILLTVSVVFILTSVGVESIRLCLIGFAILFFNIIWLFG